MAINRFNTPAEQNLMQTYVPLPFQEMTAAAQMIQGRHDKAEKLAANMIMDGSLHGSMDQVEGLLEFQSGESPEESWDRAITGFCLELNRVTDAIKAEQ